MKSNHVASVSFGGMSLERTANHESVLSPGVSQEFFEICPPGATLQCLARRLVEFGRRERRKSASSSRDSGALFTKFAIFSWNSDLVMVYPLPES